MKLKSITTELLVEDITNTINWYSSILGFSTDFLFPDVNPTFAQISKDSVQIKIFQRNEFKKEIPKFDDMKMGGTFVMYCEIDNIDKFFEDVKEKTKVIKPLYSTDYSTKEFSIEDCNGYVPMFSGK